MTPEVFGRSLHIGKYVPSTHLQLHFSRLKNNWLGSNVCDHIYPAKNEVLLTSSVSASDVGDVISKSCPSFKNISFLVLFTVRQLVFLFYISATHLSVSGIDAITSLTAGFLLNFENASVTSGKKSQVFHVFPFLHDANNQTCLQPVNL